MALEPTTGGGALRHRCLQRADGDVLPTTADMTPTTIKKTPQTCWKGQWCAVTNPATPKIVRS